MGATSRAAVERWTGLTPDEIISVLEKHFASCDRFYTTGAGDQHFNMVQSAMLKALEAEEHREPYRQRSSRGRAVITLFGAHR
jgi:hypothetical protein